MPKFTKDELEEIRQNAERLEAQKEAKQEKKAQKKTKSSSRGKKKKNTSSLQEKLVAPFLLLVIIGITYLVMLFS